jgi:hypothetical protein
MIAECVVVSERVIEVYGELLFVLIVWCTGGRTLYPLT